MEKTPIETHRKTLDIATIALRLCGCWDYQSTQFSLRVVNFLSRIFNWLIVMTIITTMSADAIINFRDLEAVTNDAGFLFPIILILMKTMRLHSQQKQINQLMTAVHNPIEKLQYSSDVGVLTIIRTAISYQNFDFCFFSIMLGLVFCIIFAITSDSEQLALRGYYFCNETVSPGYEIAFFLQLYTIFMCCLWVVIIDTTMLGLIRWINLQLYIIRFNYKNCNHHKIDRADFTMTREAYEVIKNYNYFKVTDDQSKIRLFIPFDMSEVNIKIDSFTIRFKLCIKHYQKLTKNINDFNEIFSSILFIQIFLVIFFTCLCLFQAVLTMNQKAKFIKYIFLLGAELVHLFYYCFFGNELINQGEAIMDSIWDSGWIDNMSPEVKDLMINALLQTTKPTVINAGYFFTLSVKTFLSIIQKSYSYFAILVTMMNSSN
ncbi:odorant receptor 83a-like [Microplitis mediator]|uniref:odorant receptor 83a-like n=1 Tax=Microplitis mediator TaxID=375433 RepID=UPI002556EC30|nr:odorant receptor 83a-like [Microplitis mediator]